MSAVQPGRRLAETLAAFAAVALAYGALLSQIPVDDVARYVDELGSNRFHWDLGHVWMQPLALLLYRGGLRVLGVMSALEAINVASVALGAAVFYGTVRQLGHSAAKAVLATAFVALSYNLLVLGPTGHIKLMVFPTLALSLHHAVLWEQEAGDGHVGWGRAALSGAWLGVGTNLLVSVLPAALFVGIFMLWRGHQARRRGWALLQPVAAYGIALGIAGAGLLLAAYGTAVSTGTTSASSVAGFLFGGLKEKESLHIGFAGWTEVPFRFVFSLIFNFAFLPTLGALGRAWLWGLLPSVTPYVASLLWQGLVALLSGAALAAIVGCGAASWKHRRSALLLPLGFVLGAATFSAYYNLNDPEHWFQFTLPITLLAVQARRVWLDRLVFGLWLVVLAAVNLGLYGVPKARFDLAGREQAYAEALGPRGLAVGYAAYPGEPDTSMFSARGAARYNIDTELTVANKGNLPLTLQAMDTAIDRTLAQGGRVLVFRALDPDDWRGPVMFVTLAGLPRPQLQAHLAARYRISGPVQVAGFPAWELQPLQAPAKAP